MLVGMWGDCLKTGEGGEEGIKKNMYPGQQNPKYAMDLGANKNILFTRVY